MIAITERQNNKTIDIDLADGRKIAQILHSEDDKISQAIEQIIPQIGDAIEKIADSFKKCGRLAYFGCGTSGRIGILDSSEMSPTFGVSGDMVQGFIAGGEKAIRFAVEDAEDSVDNALKDIKTFSPMQNDVVIGISASGNAVYVQKILEYAKTKGAFIIALTSNPLASINEYADIILCTKVGEEAIVGSSRLKSGTAHKIVLNMLSTGAMIRIGKVYHNYMIDLEMTNDKLRKRALRFVMEITNCDEQTAQKSLSEAQNVKVACVMILCRCNKDKAKEMLQKHNGFLREVLLK